MSPRFWTVLLSACAVAAIGLLSYFLSVPPAGPQAVQASTGQELYLANCAKCHGANLEGQREDWQTRNENGRLPAPPHDESGHTWHHSDKQLFTITKFGLQAIAPGYESDMPAFENVLSDDEIRSILSYIKSTWPERERNYQAERSRADP
jgi:mono/diheme cytochrome c family protein